MYSMMFLASSHDRYSTAGAFVVGANCSDVNGQGHQQWDKVAPPDDPVRRRAGQDGSRPVHLASRRPRNCQFNSFDSYSDAPRTPPAVGSSNAATGETMRRAACQAYGDIRPKSKLVQSCSGPRCIVPAAGRESPFGPSASGNKVTA